MGYFIFRKLPRESSGYRPVHVTGSGTATQSCNDEPPGNIWLLGAIGLFWPSVSFRELPRASAVGSGRFHVRGSGTATRCCKSEMPKKSSLLGGWAISSALELPRPSAGPRSVYVRVSGAAPRSCNDEPPGNIWLLVAIGVFLASVCFRGLLVCPCDGVLVRQP